MRVMSEPLIVMIPHRLGKNEAVRRIKAGIERAKPELGRFMTIEDETWTGDRLAFSVKALGQRAAGFIDVYDAAVRLEVTLPWLLAKIAEKFTPAIRKEGTLMLEKK